MYLYTDGRARIYVGMDCTGRIRRQSLSGNRQSPRRNIASQRTSRRQPIPLAHPIPLSALANPWERPLLLLSTRQTSLLLVAPRSVLPISPPRSQYTSIRLSIKYKGTHNTLFSSSPLPTLTVGLRISVVFYAVRASSHTSRIVKSKSHTASTRQPIQETDFVVEKRRVLSVYGIRDNKWRCYGTTDLLSYSRSAAALLSLVEKSVSPLARENKALALRKNKEHTFDHDTELKMRKSVEETRGRPLVKVKQSHQE